MRKTSAAYRLFHFFRAAHSMLFHHEDTKDTKAHEVL